MNACNYYDWCDSGMNPDNVTDLVPLPQIETCCNDTDGPAPCCSIGSTPEKNCSVAGAVRNSSVSISPDFCWNENYDITDVCINIDYRANVAQTCSIAVCGDGVCVGDEKSTCPEDCE